VRLHDIDKLTFEQIAEKLGRFKNGIPHARSVSDQYYLKHSEVKEVVAKDVSAFDGGTDLSSMSRKQRFDHLDKTLDKSERAKHTFNHILSPEEVLLFKEEYYRILREQDSLTNAEEQQLFGAILNYVLAARALQADQMAIRAYNERTLPGNDPRTIYDSRFHEQYGDHYKQYQDGLRALKLSREQRLKDITSIGNTFRDFAEVFAKKENQEGIADEILKIEGMTEAEIKRLQENGWLIFGRSELNNPEVNYGQELKQSEINTQEPKV